MGARAVNGFAFFRLGTPSERKPREPKVTRAGSSVAAEIQKIDGLIDRLRAALAEGQAALAEGQAALAEAIAKRQSLALDAAAENAE